MMKKRTEANNNYNFAKKKTNNETTKLHKQINDSLTPLF